MPAVQPHGRWRARRNENDSVKTFAIVAAVLVLAGGNAVTVTLSAPTHRPKINVHWPYVVRVTRGGKPVSARITAQIVDPAGGVHPVEFGANTKLITNFRFRGVFRDYIVWPPESRGIPLKFRVIVVGTGFRRVTSYTVIPHA
jgi:hypothetical protein